MILELEEKEPLKKLQEKEINEGGFFQSIKKTLSISPDKNNNSSD